MGIFRDITGQLFGSSTSVRGASSTVNKNESRKFSSADIQRCVDRSQIGNSELQRRLIEVIVKARNGEYISIVKIERTLKQFAVQYAKEKGVTINEKIKRIVQSFIQELEMRSKE